MSDLYPLQQLFPKGDFEWAFRMRKADPVEFFAPSGLMAEIIEQKERILSEHPDRHLLSTPEADPLRRQLRAQLIEWQALNSSIGINLEEMACGLEPDLLLMDQSSLRLVAGAVCFPSSWNPANWLGEPIHKIHDMVPQLNPQIGQMIERFLKELRPGKAFQRANWSFTRSAELNYHPALQRPPLDSSIQLEDVFLRIEHQLFTAIENGILMGIRIQPIPILSLIEEKQLCQNLIQILETMPDDVAHYKNLHLGKAALIKLMRSR